MSAEKIAKEVAEKEFERFLVAMDIEDHVDEEGLDKDEVRQIRKAKRMFVRAVQKGRLTVDDAGHPVYTTVSLEQAQTLSFRRPKGEAFMVGDDESSMAVSFNVLAQMTGVPARTFARMEYNDLEVVQAITKLFLG